MVEHKARPKLKNVSIMTPTSHQMASMLNDYFADPNCFAHLWIDDDAIGWSEDAKKLFVELVQKINHALAHWLRINQ